MLSSIFRQSNLDRIHSIMGIWVLTLTLTLGILIGEEPCLRDSLPTNIHRTGLISQLPLVPSHLANTVFVQRNLKNWLESSSDWSRAGTLTAMSQASPFERSTEPDFCESNPKRRPIDLSIKLTNRRLATPPVPVLYLIAVSPFEQDRVDRKESNSHGAFVSGGVTFVR